MLFSFVVPSLANYFYKIIVPVYLDDLKQSCSKNCGYECDETDYEVIDDQWKSLVLLIPLRLGGERMNPTYDPCLKGLLSLEQCIGIIGGKPKHSQYFIGWQGQILYFKNDAGERNDQTTSLFSQMIT